MADTRNIQVRMQELMKLIDDESEKRSIKIVPVLSMNLQSIKVMTIYVDLNNPEEVKKFGLDTNETNKSSLLVN